MWSPRTAFVSRLRCATTLVCAFVFVLFPRRAATAQEVIDSTLEQAVVRFALSLPLDSLCSLGDGAVEQDDRGCVAIYLRPELGAEYYSFAMAESRGWRTRGLLGAAGSSRGDAQFRRFSPGALASRELGLAAHVRAGATPDSAQVYVEVFPGEPESIGGFVLFAFGVAKRTGRRWAVRLRDLWG